MAVGTYSEMLDEIASSDRRTEFNAPHELETAESPGAHARATDGSQLVHKRTRDNEEEDDGPGVFKRKPDVKLFPSSWNEELDDSVHPHI